MPEVDLGDGSRVHIDGLPDECPVCHRGVEVAVATQQMIQRGSSSILEVVVRCPRSDCRRYFIASYYQSLRSSFYAPVFLLRDVAPHSPRPANLSDAVKKLSPSLAEVLEQVSVAEALKLSQLVGMGYRKALEFLVKDFCIATNAAKAEHIKSIKLGDCIKEFISDPNIKACAERASWLGNDETHYVRRWEDKDITDLKALFELTLSGINTSLLTEHYLREMPKSDTLTRDPKKNSKG